MIVMKSIYWLLLDVLNFCPKMVKKPTVPLLKLSEIERKYNPKLDLDKPQNNFY
jgi:hypothetical protein